VGLVEHEQRPPGATEGGDVGHRGHVAVHGEDDVGDHQGGARRRLQQGLEMVDVAVVVDGDLGARQTGPVDDRGVVELVGQDADPAVAEDTENQRASASSSSSWQGRLPVTSRLAPEPEPQRSRASWAAATTAGCVERPR
jgi:hypothetical protein